MEGSIEVDEGVEGVGFRPKPSGFAGLPDRLVFVSSGHSSDDFGSDDLDDVGLGELAARDFSGADAVDGVGNRSTLWCGRMGDIDRFCIRDGGKS